MKLQFRILTTWESYYYRSREAINIPIQVQVADGSYRLAFLQTQPVLHPREKYKLKKL